MNKIIDIELLKDAFQISQRCRRNWDLSTSIPLEHLNILKQSVINSPTKQNEEYYSVTFITDRVLIEKIYHHTDFNTDIKMSDLSKNPQVLANLLVVFSKADPKTFRNEQSDYVTEELMSENRNISIGIASGQLALAAALLGYRTGFCGCFDRVAVGDLLEDYPLLLLGIGYPDTNKDRTEHQFSKIKFNTFNKPLRIKNINSPDVTTELISGEVSNKGFITEIKFTAPKEKVLFGKGKEWLKQAGFDTETIQKLVSNIQKFSDSLNIDPGYPYVNFDENSLRYVWTSDNNENLNSLKDYVLSQSFIGILINQGWKIE
jgi:nitroreductase